MIKKSVNDVNKEREENGIASWQETQKRMSSYQRLEGRCSDNSSRKPGGLQRASKSSGLEHSILLVF